MTLLNDRTSGRTPEVPADSNPAPASARLQGLRWRWYHYYFLLALFDVVVIIVSLAIYHRTLTSYQIALESLAQIDEKQRWVTSLRLTVIELNAPGNDVFESRDVAAERDRFDRTHKRLKLLAMRDDELRLDLTTFEGHVESMIREEQRIFDYFSSNGFDESGPTPAALGTATVFMAAMDRHQALALEELARVERSLQEQEEKLLDRYGSHLAASADFEKYMFVTVSLILVGMFVYGKKLHRMYAQMEEDQRRAVEERRERLAAVGEVCSAVAHGMRNPLAAVSASAQLALRAGTMDEPTRMRMNDVVNECRRLNTRITRLLDFSRVPERSFEVYDVQEVVAQVVHELKPRIDEQGVTIETTLEDRPVCVLGDSERLAQSLIELISNSLDNLIAGGHIRIVCAVPRNPPASANISVIDDGPGIPERIRARVFELFFTSKIAGNGIGLASVKRNVELQGGEVAVVDDGQPGAHLRMTLPLHNRTGSV